MNSSRVWWCLFILGCGPSVESSSREEVVAPVGDVQRQPDFAGAAEAACPSVAAESAYCVTSSDGDAYLVGMDTGQLCALGTASGLTSAPDGCASRAWLRDDVLTCTSPGTPHGGFLSRLRLPAGSWEFGNLDCGAATRWSNGFVVTAGEGHEAALLYFEDFAQAAANGPVSTMPVVLNSACIAAQHDVLYVAGSTNDIERFHLPSGEPLPAVTLDSIALPVTGLSVLLDGRVAVLSRDIVYLMDASSGAVVREVAPSPQVGTLAGLTCRESSE